MPWWDLPARWPAGLLALARIEQPGPVAGGDRRSARLARLKAQGLRVAAIDGELGHGLSVGVEQGDRSESAQEKEAGISPRLEPFGHLVLGGGSVLKGHDEHGRRRFRLVRPARVHLGRLEGATSEVDVEVTVVPFQGLRE